VSNRFELQHEREARLTPMKLTILDKAFDKRKYVEMALDDDPDAFATIDCSYRPLTVVQFRIKTVI
jgi:hypothetical protein